MVTGDTEGIYAGFKVLESGRQRVLLEKKKNVHAFVWSYYPELDEAKVLEDAAHLSLNSLVRVSYNPYKAGHFVDPAGNPVKSAKQIWLTPAGVYTLNPSY